MSVKTETIIITKHIVTVPGNEYDNFRRTTGIPFWSAFTLCVVGAFAATFFNFGIWPGFMIAVGILLFIFSLFQKTRLEFNLLKKYGWDGCSTPVEIRTDDQTFLHE